MGSSSDEDNTILELRRRDLADGGAENIVKIQNLPDDYDTHVIRCLLEEKGFASSTLFFAIAGDECHGRAAFVKLTSDGSANRLRQCLNGFEAWSHIEHKLLAAFRS
eukprot:11472493-Karenia_brevis.AAC.1